MFNSRDHSVSLELHITHLQKRIAAIQTRMQESKLRSLESPDDDVTDVTNRLKNNVRLAVEDHQHPLADNVFEDDDSPSGTVTSVYIPSSGQLRREIDSIALDWRSLRNIKECVCSTPFDHFSKKVSPSVSKSFFKRNNLLMFIFLQLFSVSLLAMR